MKPDRQAPAERRISHPFRWRYAFGFGCLALGALVLAISIFSVVRTTRAGLKGLRIPGDQTLSLEKSGAYLAFAETPSGAAASFPGLQMTLKDLYTGELVPLMSGAGTALPRAARQGTVLFQAEIPDSGDYQLTISDPLETFPPGGRAWLLHESLQTARQDLGAGLLVFLILAVSGTVILIKTRALVKRAATTAEPVPARKSDKR